MSFMSSVVGGTAGRTHGGRIRAYYYCNLVSVQGICFGLLARSRASRFGRYDGTKQENWKSSVLAGNSCAGFCAYLAAYLANLEAVRALLGEDITEFDDNGPTAVAHSTVVQP